MKMKFAALAGAAVAGLGFIQAANAQNIAGSTSSTSSWVGTPVFQTGAGPTTDSGGTTNDNDSWGGNSNGANGFGALGMLFEVTTSGTLGTAQLGMAGAAATFNVELYNLGTPPSGYQAASGSPAVVTGISGVGSGFISVNGGAYNAAPDLLQAGDTFTYNGVGAGDDLEVLTFQNADASVPLIAGDLYMLSLDPTANADGTWWQRGGLPAAAYNTGEGINTDGAGVFQQFESKSSVRDFDLAITEAPVPEPATFGLIGIASLGLLARRRRQIA